MRFFLTRPLIAAAAVATALGAVAAPAMAGDRPSGEEKLAKLIGNRVAGEARGCISNAVNARMTIIDGTAIVVRQGSTLWVNVPRNAEDLDSDDVLVSRPTGSQLCRQDHLETYDRFGFFMNGVVFLGDFVPYRKPA